MKNAPQVCCLMTRLYRIMPLSIVLQKMIQSKPFVIFATYSNRFYFIAQ